MRQVLSTKALLLLLPAFLGAACGAEPSPGPPPPDGSGAMDRPGDLVVLASDGAPEALVADRSPDTPPDGPGALDSGTPDAPQDALVDARSEGPRDSSPEVSPEVLAPSGIAPAGAVPGERAARDGENTVTLPRDTEVVLRVESTGLEHLAFRFDFAPPGAVVVLRVDRWEGAAARELGRTDAGAGLRVLAVFDPQGPRTFWARVHTTGTLTRASLTITRTPFRDGPRCAEDCARLLQLPLPNDPARDGYATAGNTVFRYQFGRRDLVQWIRAAGQQLVRQGRAPFVPEDLSQWDGDTPGDDVGAPRHASHQRGRDVDLSLYGTDGRAPWRSYCEVRAGSSGRECVSGTVRGYDGVANAALFAPLFATGRVTMCFLDRELITATRAALDAAVRAGLVDPSLRGLYGDGVHLQHWPNHDNHIHVRVSEAAPGALVYEPFEAP